MLRLSNTVEIPAYELVFQCVTAQGPGGQNVNKTATAVQLFFDIPHSSLPPFYKERLMAHRDSRITEAGLVVIKVQDSRSQDTNRAVALERLKELILAATKTQRKRRPTKPTRGSQQRRVEAKKQRGQTKAMRRKPLD